MRLGPPIEPEHLFGYEGSTDESRELEAALHMVQTAVQALVR